MCHGICVGGQKTSFQKPVFFYHVCSGTRLRAPDLVSAVPTENLCSLREDLKGLGGGSRESKGICVLGTHKGRLKEESRSGGESLWGGSGGWDNMRANQSDTCMELP